MAKNELFPFANGEDANVLPTAQWEALTDILENGFQSGIAKSEQVNRVLSQGAVASYVLGQLIVDQLNKDATLDKSALYKNLILALQENAKDACLPLSGGTISGDVASASGMVYKASTDDSRMALFGGTTENNGAILILSGKDRSGSNGHFTVSARNGTNTVNLTGQPDGNLYWGGKNVVCVSSWHNGTSWYRKYSDGFIEQGGVIAQTSNGYKENQSLTFPTAFSNINYSIVFSGSVSSAETISYGTNNIGSRTTTGVTYCIHGNPVASASWYACGY